MDYQKYIEFCRTTESIPDTVTVDKNRLSTAVRLVTTANQMLDLLKKNIFYGKGVDETKWLDLLRTVNQATSDGMEHHRKCMNHPTDREEVLDFDVRLAHSIIGMNTETGEVLEAFEKAVFGDEEFDTVNFGEELGDIQWYTAIGVDAGGLNFDQVLETNKTKLQSRYSSGSFSNEEANQRDLDTEREILEDGLETSEPMSLDDKLNEDVEIIEEIISKDSGKE